MNDRDLLCFVIQLKNHILLDENEGVGQALGCVLEVVSHGNFVEDRYLANYDSLVLQKRIIVSFPSTSLLPEDKQLILTLLVHDEVLSRNHCQPVLVVTLLDSNNFIRLSTICLEQLDFGLSAYLECVGVVHNYLVNPRNQKRIRLDKFHAF